MEIKAASDRCDEQLKDKLTKMHEYHLKQAKEFYVRKKKERLNNDPSTLVICLDYQKNYSLPNITTGDVYYKRQLSVYNFNIHEVKTGRAYFFIYDETVAKKGCNEVI